MDRTSKTEAVETLKEKLAQAQSLILTDFRGITVENDTELRNQFRKAGCEYKVVKNTLLSLAVAGTPMEGIASMLQGPTAIAFSVDEPGAPAKVLTDFAKKVEKLQIKGGYVDGQVLDAKGVEALSKLPGKDQVRAMLLATFMAPAQTFVRLTSAAQTNFMYLLQAREKSQQGG